MAAILSQPQCVKYVCTVPELGVTTPIFPIPLFSKFFPIIKLLVTYGISRSYQTGVTTVMLRSHLPDMYMTERITQIIFHNEIAEKLINRASVPPPQFDILNSLRQSDAYMSQ